MDANISQLSGGDRLLIYQVLFLAIESFRPSLFGQNHDFKSLTWSLPTVAASVLVNDDYNGESSVEIQKISQSQPKSFLQREDLIKLLNDKRLADLLKVLVFSGC